MAGIRKTGIMWLIAGMAMLLVVVVLVVGNRSFKVTEKATFDEFNRRQLVMAKETAEAIELYIESLARALSTLDRNAAVSRFEEVPARQELRHTFYELRSLGVNDVGLLDANGILRYNVAARQIEGTDFSWRRYFQEVRDAPPNATTTTYAIEFIEFRGAEAGRKGVIIAVPIFGPSADGNAASLHGSFVGVAICTLQLDTITDRFVAPLQSSRRGHAFLIDSEYNALWAPDQSFFGRNLLEMGGQFPSFRGVLGKMMAGHGGTGQYAFHTFDDSTGRYTKDSEEKLIAYAPIRLGKEMWAIGVWGPKDDVRDLIHSAYLNQLLVVGVSIAVILAGSCSALVLYSRINRALENRVEAATGEIRESHERLLTVLDSLDAAVYVADVRTHEILFANRYLLDRFGEVAGKKCWSVLPSDQSGPCDFCVKGEFSPSGGDPSGVNVRELRNPSAGTVFEIRDRAIGWTDGRKVRLEIAVDITDRRRAEQERQKLEAQVQHAQKLESLGVLAGGIAHDFNNLLVAILGNADLALMDMSPAAAERPTVEGIKKAAIRAAELTNQMLAYSGKGQFVVKALDLNELIKEMGHLLEVSITRKVVLRFDLADNLPAVSVDVSQIRQIVMNLITNASEAIGEASGMVTLRTSTIEADRKYLSGTYLADDLPEGYYVCLEVSDTGCGMDAETKAKLFDPFFTTKLTGRGLGLAAVQGIVRGHRGAIRVYSEVGKGTTFRVLLPASEEQARALPARGGRDEPLWQGDGTVLVAEDEETVRNVAKKMLTRKGFTVLTARDGKEAVDIFREKADQIDAVLLDMTMPIMSGEETFRQLRQIRPDARIILCSGYNEQDATNRFAGKGLAGFIQKPFEMEKLVGAIRSVLDTST